MEGIMATLEATRTLHRKSPLRSLWFQVIVAIVAGIVVGRFAPATGAALKPLGDGFIRLITMVITAIIFCTIVSGIAGMQDAKRVSKVGAKALLYFEVISTIALLLGLVLGNAIHPGSGFNVNPASLDTKSVLMYADQAKATGIVDFVERIIPLTLLSGFATGNILQVVLVAILAGFAIGAVGQRAEPLLRVIDSATQVVFRIVNYVMVLAPIGAFGAMAFTVGRWGLT